MAVMHRSVRQQQIAEGEAAGREREARERAEAEAGRRAEERLRVQVEDELRSELAALKARAGLTPEQRTEERFRELERPLRERITPWPARPIGWALMREKVLREWRAHELEERETAVGLPEKQAAWDKRHQEIEDARTSVIRKAQERCREAEAGARAKAEHDLEALGGRPTLNQYEQVTV